jgi:hypothetical protein
MKARQILKADEVAFEGPLQLTIDPPATHGCQKAASASAGPSVRIAQNHAEYAVIEVTCPCGRTTYVRCDYEAGNASPASEEPARS